jgi:hypothetical protein
LKDAFANKIPIWKKEQKELITKYGDKILGTCTVEQAYGGMRSVKSMVYETSLLDPVEVSFVFSSYLLMDCWAFVGQVDRSFSLLRW